MIVFSNIVNMKEDVKIPGILWQQEKSYEFPNNEKPVLDYLFFAF